MSTEPLDERKPRFGLLNVVFGMALLSAGAYKTWRSAEAAKEAGGGNIDVFWLALILGTVLVVAGGVQLILQKR